MPSLPKREVQGIAGIRGTKAASVDANAVIRLQRQPVSRAAVMFMPQAVARGQAMLHTAKVG